MKNYLVLVLQGLIKDLLPIIDNFERALAVEGAAGTPLHDGISMVYNQINGIFERKMVKGSAYIGRAFFLEEIK